MVTLGVGALLLFGASHLVGRTVLGLAHSRVSQWLAPGVGLATMIVVAGAATQLSGSASVAAVALALLTAWALFRSWARPTLTWRGALVVACPVLLALLPFVASERFGVLGVSFNNDTSVHLLWAEGLRDEFARGKFIPPDFYPLGPHALVAALGELTAIELATLFNALAIVTLVCTACAAQAFLSRAPALLAAVAGGVVALPYLTAGYYGQGSFKELLVPLALICYIGLLRDISADPPHGRRQALLTAIGPGIVAASVVWAYSYWGISWLAGSLLVWALLEAVASSLAAGRPRIGARVRGMGWVVVFSGLVCLVGVLPEAIGILSYFSKLGTSPTEVSDLGNLVGPLPFREGLALWLSPDYRLPAPDPFRAGELSTLATAVGVFALVWSLKRRELAVVSMAVVGAGVFLWSDKSQSPYVAAKALQAFSPVFVLMSVGALLNRDLRDPAGSDATRVRLVVGVVFLAAAVYSSSIVLRGSFVQPSQQLHELRRLSAMTDRRPTLFLGNDDHVSWMMRDSLAGYLASGGGPPSPIAVAARPEKPFSYGKPIDFDSFAPAELDRFDFAVTTRTAYDSGPPPNFRRVARTPLFELWQRRGATPMRQTTEPADAPGAVLDCGTRDGQRLRRLGGVARVIETPVVVQGLAAVAPGGESSIDLVLPAGRWDISVQYVSPRPLSFRLASGQSWRMPPNLGRPGPFFSIGTFDSRGAADRLTMRSEIENRLSSPSQVTYPGLVAATRVDTRGTVMPVGQACGRYVDWFRPRSRPR